MPDTTQLWKLSIKKLLNLFSSHLWCHESFSWILWFIIAVALMKGGRLHRWKIIRKGNVQLHASPLKEPKMSYIMEALERCTAWQVWFSIISLKTCFAELLAELSEVVVSNLKGRNLIRKHESWKQAGSYKHWIVSKASL